MSFSFTRMAAYRFHWVLSIFVLFCFSSNKFLSNLRTSFFSIESTNTKREFMRMMNQSCGGGNFTCSFNDREMSEYIQYRKRKDPVDVKSVATVLGEQPNGNIWILNKELRSVTWMRMGPSSIQVTLLFTGSQIRYLIQQLLQQEAALW